MAAVVRREASWGLRLAAPFVLLRGGCPCARSFRIAGRCDAGLARRTSGPAYMGVALNARQSHSPHHWYLCIAAVARFRARSQSSPLRRGSVHQRWSLEHRSSCALEGFGSGAAPCASCPSLGWGCMFQQLPRGTAQPSARAKWASSDSRPHISYERRSARPSSRWWLRAVQPPVRAKPGPAASAGPTHPTSEAAPSSRR